MRPKTRTTACALLATVAVLLAGCADQQQPASPQDRTSTEAPEAVQDDPTQEETAPEPSPSQEPTSAVDEQTQLASLEEAWGSTSPEDRQELCEGMEGLTEQQMLDALRQSPGPGTDISEESLVGFFIDACRDVPAQAQAPEVFQVGEVIERPTADLVVNVLEERESISTPNSFGSQPSTLTPGPGERLWYADITWTNNLPEAVSKECHGPYAMNLRAYDLQGRQMLMVDQPGFIEGQNCSTGLMQGQTGTWLTAFRGLDEEFGWLAFEDYNGDPAFVVLDPAVDLHYTE